MFQAFRTKLELKILLLLTTVLIAIFGTFVVLTIQKESDALEAQQQEKLTTLSDALSSGIRNVMLTGKSPLTHTFLNDARDSLKLGSVTVYDRFGREVFLREGEGIVRSVVDSSLERALSTRSASGMMMGVGEREVFTRYEPLVNRQECWRCHPASDPLRGALQLALRPGAFARVPPESLSFSVGRSVADVVAKAFRTIMLGGQGEMMDTLMRNGTEIPGVRRIQVYAKDGYLAFGPEESEMEEGEVLHLLRSASREPVFHMQGGTLRVIVPLFNEDRCQVCHGSSHTMRGLLVVDLEYDLVRRVARDRSGKQLTTMFQAAIFEGFRSIMLVGRASSARYYMDALRTDSVVHTLRVFDVERNERFLNPPARDRAQLAGVIRSREPLTFMESVGGEEFLVRLSPLPNEVRCYTCHGKRHDVRGVLEVSASMAEINRMITENKVRSAGVGLLTILLVWLVLRIFIRTVVVKPVQVIEGVASRVGKGDFSVYADVRTLDEIGRLARRINEMVKGLRERFHLQKFVSLQTVEAVRSASDEGIRLGGERKTATVFFSDVRGFTSFAESVEPERVVTVLNDVLSRQSAIVRRHGGDIDKYVGDELVAVFEGEGMVERAVRAAIEIQRTLSIEEPAVGPRLSVGVGINTGEMVMGAMGSMERMDYTVIGDHVNLGARLCSSAGPGEILISESSARHIENRTEFVLQVLAPIAVKGKQDPVRLFAVKWEGKP